MVSEFKFEAEVTSLKEGKIEDVEGTIKEVLERGTLQDTNYLERVVFKSSVSLGRIYLDQCWTAHGMGGQPPSELHEKVAALFVKRHIHPYDIYIEGKTPLHSVLGDLHARSDEEEIRWEMLKIPGVLETFAHMEFGAMNFYETVTYFESPNSFLLDVIAYGQTPAAEVASALKCLRVSVEAALRPAFRALVAKYSEEISVDFIDHVLLQAAVCDSDKALARANIFEELLELRQRKIQGWPEAYVFKECLFFACRVQLNTIAMKICHEPLDLNSPPLLWFACDVGNEDLALFLIRNRGKLNLDIHVEALDGTTALEICIVKSRLALVKEFVTDKAFSFEDVLVLCAKIGSLGCLQHILNLDPSFMQDRSSRLKVKEALILADKLGTRLNDAEEIFRENSHDLWRSDLKALSKTILERHSVSLRRTLGEAEQDSSSELVAMSRDFPVMNPRVEIANSVGKPAASEAKADTQVLSSLEKNFLGKFCLNEKTNFGRGMSLNEARLQDVQCTHEGNRKLDCRRIHDSLDVLCLLESFLLTHDSPLKPLRPNFLVVGSVVEGTRISMGDELDAMMVFRGLDKGMLRVNEDNAHEVIVTEKGEALLGPFANQRNIFIYQMFLRSLLRAIEEGLSASKSDLPETLTLNVRKESQHTCKNCDRPGTSNENSIHDPFSHCMDCLPAVTHTRAGPCLLMEWTKRVDKFTETGLSPTKPVLMSIDLVPAFPMTFSSVDGLFRSVLKTLKEKMAPGWARQYSNVIRKDRTASDVMFKLEGENVYEIKEPLVCFKILHYGPEANNSIIKPSQLMDVSLFGQKNQGLRSLYCTLKFYRDLFRLDVSSYAIKKVVLSPKVVSLGLKRNDTQVTLYNLLLYVVRRTQLREAFEPWLDFSGDCRYRTGSETSTPLLRVTERAQGFLARRETLLKHGILDPMKDE